MRICEKDGSINVTASSDGRTIARDPIMTSWERRDDGQSWILQPRFISKYSRGGGNPVRPKDDVGIPGSMRAFKGNLGGVEAATRWNGYGNIAGVMTKAIE